MLKFQANSSHGCVIKMFSCAKCTGKQKISRALLLSLPRGLTLPGGPAGGSRLNPPEIWRTSRRVEPTARREANNNFRHFKLLVNLGDISHGLRG